MKFLEEILHFKKFFPLEKLIFESKGKFHIQLSSKKEFN